MERQDPQLDADRYRVTQPGAGAPGHRRRTGKTGGLNDLRGDRFLDNYRASLRNAMPATLAVPLSSISVTQGGTSRNILLLSCHAGQTLFPRLRMLILPTHHWMTAEPHERPDTPG